MKDAVAFCAGKYCNSVVTSPCSYIERRFVAPYLILKETIFNVAFQKVKDSLQSLLFNASIIPTPKKVNLHNVILFTGVPYCTVLEFRGNLYVH